MKNQKGSWGTKHTTGELLLVPDRKTIMGRMEEGVGGEDSEEERRPRPERKKLGLKQVPILRGKKKGLRRHNK